MRASFLALVLLSCTSKTPTETGTEVDTTPTPTPTETDTEIVDPCLEEPTVVRIGLGDMRRRHPRL